MKELCNLIWYCLTMEVETLHADPDLLQSGEGALHTDPGSVHHGDEALQAESGPKQPRGTALVHYGWFAFSTQKKNCPRTGCHKTASLDHVGHKTAHRKHFTITAGCRYMS